jgi:hypothetical protein
MHTTENPNQHMIELLASADDNLRMIHTVILYEEACIQAMVTSLEDFGARLVPRPATFAP